MVLPAKEWIDLAVQVSFDEPAVFSAIAALGGISNPRQTFHHTFIHPETSIPYQRGLRQYCKATAALQRYIAGALNHQASIEPVLLCCVLFACFEVFRGKGSLALSHIRLGRRAIESVDTAQGTRPVGGLVSGSRPAIQELLSTCEKLDNESATLRREKPVLSDEDPSSFVSLYPSLPAYFSSVEQAHDILEDISNASERVRIDLLRLAEDHIALGPYAGYELAVKDCIVQCLSRTVDIGLDHPVLRRKDGLIHVHKVWSTMLAKLVETNHPLDARILSLMQIQHFFSSYTLQTSRETRECESDRFADVYARILDVADRFVTLANVDATTSPPLPPKHQAADYESQRSFSLMKGILPVLFLICLKCRVKASRERALALLRSADRREGLHSSRELCFYATSLIDLEEWRAKVLYGRARSADLDALQIPEEARFLDILFENRGFHDVRIACGRYQHEHSGQLEIVEYQGSGGPPPQLSTLRRIEVPFRC